MPSYELIEENLSTEEQMPMNRVESNENYSKEDDALIGTTAAGKRLMLAKHPTYAGYFFKWEGGGQIPNQLDGVWLTFHEGRKQGELYLNAKADEDSITVKASKKVEK